MEVKENFVDGKLHSDADIFISNLESLSILEAEEEKQEIRGVFDFDLGIVSHPKYGSAHVRGTVPLLLGKGVYTFQSSDNIERVVKIISDWLDEHHLRFGEPTSKYLRIRRGVESFSTVATNDLSTPLEIGICALNVLYFYLDDVEEETGLGVDYGGDFANTTPIFNLITNIFKGKFERVEDIPDLDMPLLDPIIWLAFLGYQQISLDVPTFKICNEYFLNEFLTTTQAMLYMSAPTLIDVCSEETYLEIRQHDVGFGPSVEMLAINHGLHTIPKHIRENLIFKRLFRAAGRALAITNDLIGLQKDLKADVEQLNNIILFKVARHGISLPEAVTQALKMIWDETNDAEFLCHKILQFYPDEEQLAEYTQCIRWVLDGHIRGYDISTARRRYGNNQFKERWIPRTSCP